jgi:S1-C subfamily serine protease
MMVAFEAARFFSREQHAALLAEYPKPDPPGSMLPFTLGDFLHYLQPRGFPHALSQGTRVQRLLNRMVDVEMLTDYGQRPGYDVYGRRYFANELATRSQSNGYLWLSEVIGAGLIMPSYGSVTVPIAGSDQKGKEHVGSGLVLDQFHVLTNAHVVRDMTLKNEIEHSPITAPVPLLRVGSGVSVVEWDAHDDIDVAVITVEPTFGSRGLPPLDGIAFREPKWADETYVFGYPPVPTTQSAHLTVQRGQVVNPSITTSPYTSVPEDDPNWPEGSRDKPDDEYFLYSAITRPGNSGGPIVAQDGRVIGIVAHDVLDPGRSDEPFYRGIPGNEVVRALTERGYGHLVTLEDWT